MKREKKDIYEKQKCFRKDVNNVNKMLRMQHSLKKKNCIIRKENIILQNLFQHETQKISLEKEKMIFARKKNDLLRNLKNRYLKKNNRKGSGEKKRERGIEKKLTVEHQSSMNCDWRKAPHSNRVNRHRSKALWQVLSNGFTCTDLSKS